MIDTPVLRLEPPPFAADHALTSLWDALPDARIVGGAVRDVLAGRPVADIDLATSLTPEAATTALTRAGLRVVPTGLDHGTITAVAHGRGFEITTLRRDLTTDGRHAVVAFTADWQQDALRRDFTINAMSMGRDGAVFDYFSGVADLHQGRVHFVGNAVDRIREDYLRILRFFRFHARYGRMTPDPDTLAALRAGIPGLGRLSIERVWTELSRILAAPDPTGAVAQMHDLGILQAVAPELGQPQRLMALRDGGAPADPILRIAAMLTGDPLAFSRRLKLSNDDRERLLRLQVTPIAHPGDTDDTLRRLLADFDRSDLIDRSWLEVSRMVGNPAGDPDLAMADPRQRLAALPQPSFSLEGRDVLKLGIPPGPRVGTLLREVRQWWLADGCVADRSTCEAELIRRACANQ